jgi:thymidylate synthase
MPEVTCRNVNSAFRTVIKYLINGGFPIIKTQSRVGDVIQITRPVTISYIRPTERVLFNKARDANPFFHVFESLWMLCGRNDVAPLAYYASDYGNITSDDGMIANGAYGYRWRNTPIDQLQVIIAHLKAKPESRRAVLSMWNVEDDLMKVDTSKDVCCNLSTTFQLVEGELDMTVFNRSNDLIWGSLGANVVHFSFLQEYVAAHLGVPVGVYNQISTNLHTYTDSRWRPEEYLADQTLDYYVDSELNRGACKPFPLVQNPTVFDQELPEFFEYWIGKDLSDRMFNKVYKEPFLQAVALPMAKAFYWHKERNYTQCARELSLIVAEDWRLACRNWIEKRQYTYEVRQRALEEGRKLNELATDSDSSKEQVRPSS